MSECRYGDKDRVREGTHRVAVPEDGGEVVLEVFEGDKLFSPDFYCLAVPLESVVSTCEHVDDGSDGLGRGGKGEAAAWVEREASAEWESRKRPARCLVYPFSRARLINSCESGAQWTITV